MNTTHNDPSIWKFGGTGVFGTAPTLTNYTQSLRLIKQYTPDQSPVIVVSAFGGVTDELEQAYQLAQTSVSQAVSCLQQLKVRHEHIVAEIFKELMDEPAVSRPAADKARNLIELHLTDIFLEAIEIARHFTPIGDLGHVRTDHEHRQRAILLSVGERVSTEIARHVFGLMRFPLTHWSASDYFFATVQSGANTDYTAARISYDPSHQGRIRELYGSWLRANMDFPDAHVGIITEGFIARDTERNLLCTCAREGSDESAVFLAKALAEGHLPVARLVKRLDPKRPLKPGTHGDLAVMQKETGSHLVAERALLVASREGVQIDICDFLTGNVTSYMPSKEL